MKRFSSAAPAPIEAEWRIVSEVRPCPVCGGTSDCKLHTFDDFASCSREPSEWPLTNGAWLHRLSSESITTPTITTITRIRSEVADAAPLCDVGS
ncbi:MAG: hypothetical protein QM756_08325 [Polyangiaceae bacterium]